MSASSLGERWTQSGGLLLGEGPADKGVVLGVTTRALGNMKDPQRRAEALAQAGLAGRPVFLLRQVHGTGILPVGLVSEPTPEPQGDGWVTQRRGAVLAVFVADCLPLFIWDGEAKAAGLFHVGWRGAAAGMPRSAAEAFAQAYGVKAKNLRAAVGPHIRSCCCRVGPEVAEKFQASSLARRGGDIYLDLEAEVRSQLGQSGVPAVACGGPCTSCRQDLFYSFRREKRDFRMMAFLSLNP